MQLSLVSWKPMVRNTLRGFASIRLGRNLAIEEITVHCKDGKRWASFPSKPKLDRDGNVVRNSAGKIEYVPILKWLDRAVADDFSNSVVEAVEREHPGATEVQPTER
jgi:hypothetical protein